MKETYQGWIPHTIYNSDNQREDHVRLVTVCDAPATFKVQVIPNDEPLALIVDDVMFMSVVARHQVYPTKDKAIFAMLATIAAEKADLERRQIVLQAQLA